RLQGRMATKTAESWRRSLFFRPSGRACLFLGFLGFFVRSTLARPSSFFFLLLVLVVMESNRVLIASQGKHRINQLGIDFENKGPQNHFVQLKIALHQREVL